MHKSAEKTHCWPLQYCTAWHSRTCWQFLPSFHRDSCKRWRQSSWAIVPLYFDYNTGSLFSIDIYNIFTTSKMNEQELIQKYGWGGEEVRVGYSNLWRHLTATGNLMPYGITQCYLLPDSRNFPAFTSVEVVLDFATPEGCKAELT